MKKDLALLCSILLIGSQTAFAEEAADMRKDQKKVYIVRTDKETKELFRQSRPAIPKAGDVALFTLKEYNNKFMMQIGGSIKPIMGWDIGNALHDVNFIPSSIPVPAAKGNKADYFANPMHSNLDVHILALPATENQVTGYIKVKFNAPKSAVQVSHVYIAYRGFLLGRTTTVFCDGESMPETIDPQGANGAIDVHSYQVSYQKKFDCGIKLGVSLELPTFDKYPGAYYGKDYPSLKGVQFYDDATQPVPDIPAYIEYRGKGMNRVRVSGIMRNFFYRDDKADKTNSVVGWGVQLSGNLQPINPLTFYYQCSYGHGIANYIQDTNGLPLSYIPKNSQPGKMTATPMMGWLAGFSYRFDNDVRILGVYSQARVWDCGDYDPDYKMGQYVAGNVFIPIKEYLQLGVEYLWGKHSEFGGKSAHLSRIQTMLRLSF